jgi:all-trans-retinol 13,14-reductase
MKKNVLIIGSGISSLTMAILLLKAGHGVRILEQHYRPGGYLHCFKRFGFDFETGGHYMGALGEGLPFQKILNYLGVYHESDYVALDNNALDSYHFDDWKFTYAIGYEANIKKLSDEFPNEKEKIKKYFDMQKEAAHAFPTYYFKSSYDQSLVLKYLDLSLAEVFDLLNISGRLKEILQAPCILHGVAPQDVSFGIHAILIDSIMVSSHGFTSGGEKLAERFVDQIKKLGGEVLLNHRVVSVDVDNELVTKVTCENGAEFEADEYVAGIHPKIIFEMIGMEKVRPAFRNRLLMAPESTPFIGAYVVLKESLGINPRSNYYFMPKDAENHFRSQDNTLHSQFGFFTTPMRNYLGKGEFPLSIHASCPEHHFSAWKPSKKKNMDLEYLQQKEKMFEGLFKKIDHLFDGFSESITDICYSSNLTNIRYNPSPNGSAYGLYHDAKVTGARSLGPRTHFANLYLTGQNTLFPGLLGATISGLRTSSFFTGIKEVLKDLEN